MLPKLILAAFLIILSFIMLFLIPKHKTDTNKENLIVFFGNSITSGQGASAGEDFPTILGKIINVPIINAGVSGNTTKDALLRIDKDVISKNPTIVVVELGGNDLLLNEKSEITKRNLDLILTKIKATNAKIVILGLKFILFTKTYETDLQSLAKKYNAIYVPNILEGIITDQNLKFDDLHPNTKGYQKIAEKLIPVISPLVSK